jgi:non-ribosomal peptide synthetase component F
MLIPDILEQAVESHSERIAVEEAQDRITYRELGERVARLAAFLREHAAAPSDRLGILAPNSSLFLEVYFAAARAGMVLVPLNTRGHTQGLARLLDHAGASSLLVHGDLVEPGREIARRCGIPMIGSDELDELSRSSASAPHFAGRPNDAVQIYYTSGTTGEPKGVILTHANVCAHAEMARDALALTDADTFGHIAPMFHLADAWATFSITLVGGRHRMVGSFRPEAVIDELSSGITITNLVPTMLGDLVHHSAARRPYPGLRKILSGGAPITPALVDRVIATFGCDYAQTYGLTETSPFLTMSLLLEHLKSRPTAVQRGFQCKTGRPLPGVEVRVLGDDGFPVPPDETTVGEIVARGPTVTPGYWRNEEATAQAFRDGWFHTGDPSTRRRWRTRWQRIGPCSKWPSSGFPIRAGARPCWPSSLPRKASHSASRRCANTRSHISLPTRCPRPSSSEEICRGRVRGRSPNDCCGRSTRRAFRRVAREAGALQDDELANSTERMARREGEGREADRVDTRPSGSKYHGRVKSNGSLRSRPCRERHRAAQGCTHYGPTALL